MLQHVKSISFPRTIAFASTQEYKSKTHLASLEVLTRRDQQKMKDDKKQQRQGEKGGKKGTGKGKKDKNQVEPKAKAKPRTRKPKNPEPEVDEDKKVDGEAEPAEVPEPKAKRQRRTRNDQDDAAVPAGKAKAKAKACPKHKGSPKPKAKRKAKATPKIPEDEDSEEKIKTPKRALFQSEDEGEKDGAPHLRRDAKTGRLKPLGEFVEECAVKDWKKSRAKPVLEKIVPEASEGENAKVEKKAKTGRKLQELSPFAKKEVKRRKKADQEIMQQEAAEDKQIQGLCHQHMKSVENLTLDNLKLYLLRNVESKFEDYRLNSYWARPAVGVKCFLLAADTGRIPEVAYFGRYGTAGSHNQNVTLQYVSASLLVSRRI